MKILTHSMMCYVICIKREKQAAHENMGYQTFEIISPCFTVKYDIFIFGVT